MPNYDGKNIYSQLQQLEGAPTLTGQINEEEGGFVGATSGFAAQRAQVPTIHMGNVNESGTRYNNQSFGR